MAAKTVIDGTMKNDETYEQAKSALEKRAVKEGKNADDFAGYIDELMALRRAHGWPGLSAAVVHVERISPSKFAKRGAQCTAWCESPSFHMGMLTGKAETLREAIENLFWRLAQERRP